MRWAALLCVVVGCSWPEATVEGAHVIVAVDEGLEMCGGTIEHMDAFVAATSAAFGVPVPIDENRLKMYWIVDDFAARTPCPLGVDGCAIGRSSSWTTVMPLNHELVHSLARVSGGYPPSVFGEGLATAFEGLGNSVGGARATQPIGTLLKVNSSHLGALTNGYTTAGGFVAALIEVHGLAAYLRAYSAIHREAGEAAIDRVFRATMGVTLDDSIALFDETRRACPSDHFTAKLVECAAPTLDWEEDGLTFHRGLDCADDDVVGPYGGDTAVVFYTVEVPEGGMYEIGVIGDNSVDRPGTGNAVALIRCGGCELPVSVRVEAGAPAREVVLPAGRYSLRMIGPAREPTSVGVRIRPRL